MSTTCCPWNAGALKEGRPIEETKSMSLAVVVALDVVVVAVVVVVVDDGARKVEGFDTEAAVAADLLRLHCRLLRN